MIKPNVKIGRVVRLVVGLVGALLLCGALFGCGGAQPPPQDGTCHAWREWVPPQQDEDGAWHSGYCRDR
jgi:hypothetical protein